MLTDVIPEPSRNLHLAKYNAYLALPSRNDTEYHTKYRLQLAEIFSFLLIKVVPKKIKKIKKSHFLLKSLIFFRN